MPVFLHLSHISANQLSAPRRKTRIRKKLLCWFEKNQRTFPWRETNEPFHLIIAEKLLQQTAATPKMIAAYEELIRRFPTPAALAVARVDNLKKIIAPLGFQYRAGELKRLAIVLIEKHTGRIPRNLQELLELPGIGDYCARAVLCFSFDHNVPIVDTNVARFYHRILGIESGIGTNPARDRNLIALAASYVPRQHAKDFNLAILDLCAKFCTSRQPKCGECPLRSECAYAATSCF